MAPLFTHFMAITSSLWPTSSSLFEQIPTPKTCITYSAVFMGFAYLYRKMSGQAFEMAQMREEYTAEMKGMRQTIVDMQQAAQAELRRSAGTTLSFAQADKILNDRCDGLNQQLAMLKLTIVELKEEHDSLAELVENQKKTKKIILTPNKTSSTYAEIAVPKITPLGSTTPITPQNSFSSLFPSFNTQSTVAPTLYPLTKNNRPPLTWSSTASGVASVIFGKSFNPNSTWDNSQASND